MCHTPAFCAETGAILALFNYAFLILMSTQSIMKKSILRILQGAVSLALPDRYQTTTSALPLAFQAEHQFCRTILTIHIVDKKC